MVAKAQECIFQDINGREHNPLKLSDSYEKRGPKLSDLPVCQLDQNRVDYTKSVSVDNCTRLSSDLLRHLGTLRETRFKVWRVCL